MNLNSIASTLIICIACVIILIYGKTLLIPFVFALLIWFLIRKLKQLMDGSSFVKDKFPNWLKSILTSLFLFFILGLLSKILTSSISTLSKSFELYESNANQVIQDINQQFNIDLIGVIRGHAKDFNFNAILQSIFNSLTEILGNAFIIIFYTLFIFIEESNFDKKLKSIFAKQDKYNGVTNTLDRIEKSITNYIGLKTLMSFITGVLSYVVLLIIGVDSPAFWAFLIFILNYIPTIGSLAGTVFPALFSLLQFSELTPFIIIIVAIGAIQVVIGNIVEPKLMGNSLNISSLVAILSLSFWGALWGITGMILSIPITVIMVIIFSQFEKTKAIAILLSEKGTIN